MIQLKNHKYFQKLNNLSQEQLLNKITNQSLHDLVTILQEILVDEEKKVFRAAAARLNFLAADCPDIQFPSKEVCRHMANPTEKAFRKLKRVARYLLSRNAVQFQYV